MMMQGTAFNTKGATQFSLMLRGKISVGEREARIKAAINKARFTAFRFWLKYQMATPLMAIINVGDSALWLKITTHIKSEASR